MCIENWKFSAELVRADRLEYLLIEIEFSKIINRIYNEMKVTDFEVDTDPINDKLKGCKRPTFKLQVDEKTFDIFFNSPCGYRGQYFIKPDHGEKMNGLLIQKIAEKLKDSVKDQIIENNITNEELQASLQAESSKIWIDEDHCDFGINIIEEIINPKWRKYAEKAYLLVKNNPDVFEKRAIWGLKAPEGNILNVKGAWIDEHKIGHITSSKTHRAEDIHKYGFS